MKKSRKKSCAVDAARWISYAAAGAVTAVGSANDSEASILFSGVLNQAMPHVGAQTHVSIKTLIANSHQGVKNLGRFTHIEGTSPYGGINPSTAAKSYRLHFRGSNNSGLRPRGMTHGATHYISKLSSGAKISTGNFIPVKGGNPMGTFNGKSTLHGDRQWTTAVTGFVAFEFSFTPSTPGTEQYGWAKVIDNGPTTYYMTLVDYAYGTVGQAMTVGETGLPVPEPASLGLLAFGAAGLLAARFGRRRETPHAAA